MVEVNLENPWVRRQDFDYKRRGRGYGKRQGNIITFFSQFSQSVDKMICCLQTGSFGQKVVAHSNLHLKP